MISCSNDIKDRCQMDNIVCLFVHSWDEGLGASFLLTRTSV